MSNRWGVLAVLFFIRTTMAVQFQSIAAVAPLLRTDFGFSLADVGILIGLYSAPGIALALPAGMMGQRFGDKNTVLAGLALMIVGGLIMAFLPSWGGQISGRVLAGIGGVLISVLMMKMVADHFAGKEISTAMAIFVSSWPIGIGIALLILPPAGVAYGASAVHVAVAALIAVGASLMAGLYNSPSVSTANPGGRPGLQATMALVLAARPRRSHRSSRCCNAFKLRCNCNTPDFCVTKRRDCAKHYCVRDLVWPSGRSNHEFACSCPSAGSSGNWYGRIRFCFLYRLSSRTRARWRIRDVGRQCGRGLRFRCRGPSDLSARSVGFSPLSAQGEYPGVCLLTR